VRTLSASGPRSIAQLTEGRRVTRQAITKHLHVLASAGLARSSRRGREQLWELEGEPLREAQRQIELLSAQWDSALQRLTEHLR